jgi:hypothetical protein
MSSPSACSVNRGILSPVNEPSAFAGTAETREGSGTRRALTRVS